MPDASIAPHALCRGVVALALILLASARLNHIGFRCENRFLTLDPSLL
jgi:hypothetical protein